MTWLRYTRYTHQLSFSTGAQFADTTVWLSIAMTLSVFQISKVDEESPETKPGDLEASVFVGCVSPVSYLWLTWH